MHQASRQWVGTRNGVDRRQEERINKGPVGGRSAGRLVVGVGFNSKAVAPAVQQRLSQGIIRTLVGDARLLWAIQGVTQEESRHDAQQD